MHSPSCFEFEVFGKQALFTNPYSDSLQSFPVPTYEALVSILRSFYWEPSFDWIPDEIRVMNPIKYIDFTESTFKSNHIEKHLINVHYKLKAHISTLSGGAINIEDYDRCFNLRRAYFDKFFGRGMYVRLGTNYCIGEMRAGDFKTDRGFYDRKDKIDLGIIYYGTNYLMGTEGEIIKEQHSWHCVMNKGVIRFPSLEQCIIETFVQLPAEQKCLI